MSMRRLFFQVYLAAVGIILLFAVLASLVWWLLPSQTEKGDRLIEGASVVLSDLLPGADRPAAELQKALERYGELFPLELEVQSSTGERLAAVGGPLPRVEPDRVGAGFMKSHGRKMTVAIPLSQGRWLLARHVHPHEPVEHGAFGGLGMIAALAVAIAIGAYPIVRRIVGRLERLQTRVDALGTGDLSTRVEVEGNDEVADLARSFNRAANRIEELVEAQRHVLAGASHELRTPLARMRVAVELLGREDRQDLRDQVAADISELDDLIEEILLGSRLDILDSDTGGQRQEVDLLALLAEEGARIDAVVSGEPSMIEGDLRMMHRLVRNLLENGRRYGSGSPVEANVAVVDHTARIRICDRGPGVSTADRERIFEPFYRPPGTGESGDGVGLGLSLVRRIARHHGGEVRCHPREGGGSCFEVLLPLRRD